MRNKKNRDSERNVALPGLAAPSIRWGQRQNASASTSVVDRRGSSTSILRSAAIEDAVALCRRVDSDPALSRLVRLQHVNRRDPAIRVARSELFAAANEVALRLFREFLQRPDARELLAHVTRRQLPSQRFLDNVQAPTEIEDALYAISDLMAELKDPCQGSVKKERRHGIVRRPYDAMPLVYPSGQLRPTGAYFKDIDRLEWVWVPLATVTLTSVDGEDYEESAPATDSSGDVAARTFFYWRGLSLSAAYKHSERKESVAGRRRAKKHPTIPGVHELDGHLRVHIPTCLAERVERRTQNWSKEAATLARPRVTSARGLTRSEKLLQQLETEGVDVAVLRKEWEEQIANERRLGIFD